MYRAVTSCRPLPHAGKLKGTFGQERLVHVDRRVERPTTGELLIYPARRRLLALSLIGIMFTICGIWMVGWADPTTFFQSELMIKVIGAFVTLFFGGGSLFLLGRAFSRRPLVLINNEGIANRETLHPLPFVRWEEVLGVSIEEEMRQRRLRFDLKDPEDVIGRCASPLSRAFHTRMLRSGRSIMNVSENHAAIPLDELRREVESHLR